LHQPGVVKTIEVRSDNGLPSQNIGFIYRRKCTTINESYFNLKLKNPDKKEHFRVVYNQKV